MSAGSFAESPTLERRPAEPRPETEPHWRAVARFGAAVAVSALMCLAVWTRVPKVLSGRIDIVGYPTFNNWDLYPMFWAYRLVIYAFPVLAIACYLLLRWRGPLRRIGPPVVRGPIVLDGREPADSATGGRLAARLGVLPRLALPLGVVVASAGTRDGHIRAFAIFSGLTYLVLVLGTAAVWSVLVARRDAVGRPAQAAFWPRLALINGAFGAAAACLAVWYVSHNTTVAIGGAVRHYPWLPLWLALLGVAAVIAWMVRQLRRGRSAAEAEKGVLTVLVGAVALFLVLSTIAAPLGWMQGFDGGQDVTGAQLLIDGYVPWRDFIFIHGLFLDGLKANFGMAIFGDSVWGVAAGIFVFLFPLCYVSVYLFAAWVSRCNPWLLALVWVCAVSGFFRVIDIRFILVPVTFIVFGEAIRRRGGLWYVGLTLLLFVESVLIPETAFLTGPALICVVAADLVHRERGERLWRALRRTRWTVATGVVTLAVFCTVMAYFHALSSFIAYYRVFGPGHNESGAIPPAGLVRRDYFFFAVGIVAVLLTAWATIRRILRHGTWRPEDWVALAASGFVALYEEKALGRFDTWHVAQVLDVAMPLVVLWGWRGLRAVNRAVVDRAAPVRLGAFVPHAATAVLLVIAIVGFATPLRTAAGNVDKQHMTAAAFDSVYPGLGYSTGDAVHPPALADLQAALDTYARDKPVFDMTNSLAYTYYLLRRIPATRFVHVSMAIPQYAQQLLISDLERSRPPVVIFDGTETGLPAWDGVINAVRHYEVSDYVLRGWVPMLRTHGYLLLVRKDLAAQGATVPTLAQAPQTSDLWFTEPTCGWGDSAAFLQSLPEGRTVRLPVRPVRAGMQLVISGWAADRTSRQASKTVVIATGDTAVTTISPFVSRPDVQGVLGLPSSLVGFSYSGVLDSDTTPTVYLLAGDGKLHPLNGTAGKVAPSVRMPDGQVLATDPSPLGYLDLSRSSMATVGQVDAPAGDHLADYSLATFSAGGRSLGTAAFEITDAPGQVGHSITASSLATQGSDLSVRVGSCIQWHGYDSTKPLYVVQSGGVPATTLTLSGVKE